MININNYISEKLHLNKDFESSEIDNIDKVAPTGSCLAKVYPKYVDIQVSPTTNKQISGYNYIVEFIFS